MGALIAYVKTVSQLGKESGNKLRVGVVVQISRKKERSYGAGSRLGLGSGAAALGMPPPQRVQVW